MPDQVYLNGELMDAGKAVVSVFNPSFLHGVGLFETLRAYGGRAFRLEQHVERLRNSAQKLQMPVGEVVEQIPEAVRRVLEANQLEDARVRVTVTPAGPSETAQNPTLLVAAQEHTGYPPEMYEKGMTVFVCTDYRQSRQDPLAGHKTTCYLPRLMALRQAQEKQCGEALWFTTENLLAEGSISSVFLVRDGRLRTPPLETPVLPGITRSIVLELAREQNVPVEETPCTIHDLLDAHEVFLTNAVMEVMPVTRVEKRAIADEKPGPVTLALAQAYRELRKV